MLYRSAVGFVGSAWQWLKLDIADFSALPTLKFDLSSRKFWARCEPLQTIPLLGKCKVEFPADKETPRSRSARYSKSERLETLMPEWLFIADIYAARAWAGSS